MRLEVHSETGGVLGVRRAENIVLRQGAAAVARLFAGADGAQPITHVLVGFGTETVTAEATGLTGPSGDPLPPASALRSSVAPGDFTVVTDQPDIVHVLVTSTFVPTVELADVSEAGLLAGDTLYNQVVFEPITLRVGQNVSFFWEIDFPFGR